MRLLSCVSFGVISVLFLTIAGCGDPNTQTASSSPNQNSGGGAARPNAQVGGGGASQSAADRNSRRNLPSASVGGGGSGGTVVNTGGSRNNANNRNTNSNSSNGESTNQSANADPSTFSASPMSANGLFPQIPGSGNTTAGFGGALFPVESTASQFTSTNSPSNNNNDNTQAASASDSNSNSVGAVDPLGGSTSDSGPGEMHEQALEAFASLDDRTGMRLLFGHLLTNDAGLEKYPIKWFSQFGEPRVAVRWGVGVIYDEPRGFDERHPVIGDSGGATGAGRSAGPGNAGLEGGGVTPPRGSGGSDERKYRNIDTSRPDGFLIYYTGEYGEKFIDALDKNRRRGYYGDILKDVPLEQPETEQAAQNNNQPPTLTPAQRQAQQRRNRRTPSSSVGGGGGGGGISGPGGGGRPPAGNNNRNTRSQNNQNNNTASTRSRRTAASKVLDRANGDSESDKPDLELDGSILPGVILLGVGKRTELIKKAQREGVDVLVYFKVKVSKTRSSGRTSSTTSMKMLDVRGPKEVEIYGGKMLKNTTVAEQKEEGRDPVGDTMKYAFGEATKSLRADDLPESLNEKNVGMRVDQLLQNIPEEDHRKFPIAIEIINFNRLGFLEDGRTATALDKLFGEDGIGNNLLSPNEADRRAAMKDLLEDTGEDL